jgi:hypothetical protein
MCIEREYWEQKNTIDRLEEENEQLKDKIRATNQFIKEFLDLVREGKIKITFPEFGIDLSTDCGPYDSDEELLREILDVYNHAVKHKEMYDSERSES